MAEVVVESRKKRKYDEMAIASPEWDARDPVPQRFFKRMRRGESPLVIAATTADKVRLAQRALQENLQSVDSEAEQCMQTRIREYCDSTTGLRSFDGSRVFTADEMRIVMRCVLNDVKRRNEEMFSLLSDRLLYLLQCTEPLKHGEASYIS